MTEQETICEVFKCCKYWNYKKSNINCIWEEENEREIIKFLQENGDLPKREGLQNDVVERG